MPRVIVHLGLWGPSAGDEIVTADHSVQAAREYGAQEADPALATAARELETARQLLAKGEEWRARQAARRAGQQAIEAQRTALGERESARRRSAMVAAEIDRRLNDLENLYTEVSVGADKPTNSELVSIMKDARRKGASVYLAIEEGDYRKAVGQEAAALEALDAARVQLEAHRTRHPATAGG
jgi:hypothetical protein